MFRQSLRLGFRKTRPLPCYATSNPSSPFPPYPFTFTVYQKKLSFFLVPSDRLQPRTEPLTDVLLLEHPMHVMHAVFPSSVRSPTLPDSSRYT